MTPIDFDDSIYDDAVSGMGVAKWCNKRFKPTAYDLSFDNHLEPNDVWFIKRDFLEEFFHILPKDCPNITVVTQHSDYEVDSRIMSIKPVCVKRIFSPNNTHVSDDSVPIPLGLGPTFVPDNIAPSSTDIKNTNTKNHRDKLLYVNFRPYTYPQERVGLMESFKMQSSTWVSIDSCDDDLEKHRYHSLTKQEYLTKRKSDYLSGLVSHKFSLCPRGNGIDTHRLWESLYCRTVPVVRYERAHRNFLDLPILFVDDWNQVTEEYLHTQYEQMLHREWDYSKLKASWWGKQFKE